MKLKTIPGSWHYSGDWYGRYLLVSTEEELGEPLAEVKDLTCPVCEYPEAVRLSKHHADFPLNMWCPACETVYQWYVAKCPDCGFFVWKKGCQEGTLVCSGCGMEMTPEFVQELNEEMMEETYE